MKDKRLTKRESDIMEVFWNHDTDLSASDIQNHLDDVSINSIQPILKRLQHKGYIHVSGISQNAKALTRVYRPSITKTQHIASMVDQKTIYELATAMVKECDDRQTLEELRKTINEKLKGQ